MELSTQSKHKFVGLDALRGLAAIAVVLYHSGAVSARLFTHAYLAVDFFFLLSGFVLSFAYGSRLANGWSLSSFMLARYLRLAPLNTLGLVLGVAAVLLKLTSPRFADSLTGLPVTFLLNFLFLPAHLTIEGKFLFPIIPVGWSLFFELFANIFHAIFLRRTSLAGLFVLFLVVGSVFAFEIHSAGMASFGALAPLSLGGIVRVLSSYVFGMILFRLWHKGNWRISGRPGFACVALILTLASPVSSAVSAAYDMTVIFLIFPVIIAVAATENSGWHSGSLLTRLGGWSYGVYIIHGVLVGAINATLVTLFGKTLSDYRPWGALPLLFLVIGAAELADRHYDAPLRARFKKFQKERNAGLGDTVLFRS